MNRNAFIAAMALASLPFAGCGPDIEVQTHTTTGSGGSGGNGGGGEGGGGGNGLACTSLVVQPTVIAMTALAQASPRMALDPATGQVLYTFLNGPPSEGASLYAMTANVFDTWPPTWTPAQMVDQNVRSYALGNGPNGPIGLVHHVNAAGQLIDSFIPQANFVDMPITDDGDLLFVTAIANRYFWGATYDTGTYDVLRFGSYQPGSLPQSDQPLICAKQRLRAHAVPSTDGFVAAMLEPNPPDVSCDPANPKPATIVSTSRFDSNTELGSTLIHSPGWRLTLHEPVVNLSLAGTSDGGAWVVYQTDGSTSEVAPPLMASRATPSGYIFGDGASATLSPSGSVFPAVAASSLGDTLAAAWVDVIDPSAPVIQIQLYDLGAPLGPATSIPTNDAWYDDDLQLLASTDKRSLLVAWTSQSITAFARVDCVP